MVPSKPAPALLAGIWNCCMREDLVAIDLRLHASELAANKWGSVETKGTWLAAKTSAFKTPEQVFMKGGCP